MSVLGHEKRFLILNRVVKRRFFGLNRMAVHPYPNFHLGFLPSPTSHCHREIIYFNITIPNILSAVIKFWLRQNYQIIQNDLPKLAIGTWISDFWNPHIMKFELIGSSNLYNKIKAHKCQDKEQFSFSYIHLLLLL